MKLRRPFSEAEAKLMDSVWDFQHPGGSFEVEFRADAFNHFVSKVWLGLPDPEKTRKPAEKPD